MTEDATAGRSTLLVAIHLSYDANDATGQHDDPCSNQCSAEQHHERVERFLASLFFLLLIFSTLSRLFIVNRAADSSMSRVVVFCAHDIIVVVVIIHVNVRIFVHTIDLLLNHLDFICRIRADCLIDILFHRLFHHHRV